MIQSSAFQGPAPASTCQRSSQPGRFIRVLMVRLRVEQIREVGVSGIKFRISAKGSPWAVLGDLRMAGKMV